MGSMRGGLALIVVAACSGGGQLAIDASVDAIPPGCGDGVKSATEECDTTDLGGATCASAAAPGWIGVASCTTTCLLNVAGCNTPTTTWSSMTDPARWSSFDVGTLYPGAKGFTSTAFDGRYLYFIPNNNGAPDGIVTRYDTQGGFGSSGSWATFDVATVNAAAKGFLGGAFDGRYLYLVPYNNGAFHGTIARYDTRASGGFGASASWSTFDIATVDPNARGFATSTFDGRYLYLAPHYNGAYHGTIARLDTQGDFTKAAAWSTFDVSTVDVNAKGFLGSTFDGRYIYFVPYYNNVAYHGYVARYDTQSPGGFGAAASWTTFNVASTNGNAVGFYGVAFDGRYVYLVQHYNGAAATPAYGGWVARYDTHADFKTGSSWSTFNVEAVNGNAKGFVGATFDGRYVYLAPYYDGVSYEGVAVRYDTQGTFTTGASWSVFNVTTLAGAAKGYHGAGFDGRYIYLAPSNNGPNSPHGNVARFDAKTPAWLPIGWNHAFD